MVADLVTTGADATEPMRPVTVDEAAPDTQSSDVLDDLAAGDRQRDVDAPSGAHDYEQGPVRHPSIDERVPSSDASDAVAPIGDPPVVDDDAI